MVGYLILLKMLNCKMQRKRSYNNYHEDSKSNYSLESVMVKEELRDPEGLRSICRVCLKYGDIAIFGNDSEDISGALTTIGGIEVSQDDKYPKFLCQSCNALLQGAVLLRKTAQQSDETLRRKPEDIFSDNDDIMHNTDDDNYGYEEEKVHKQKTTYHCKKCDLDFKSFREHRDHRLSLEHINFRRTCPICKNSYTAPYFEKHLALHRLETKFMCDICGKKFVIQGQFNRHRLTHFNNFPFKCTLCPYKGKFNESLKMHMRTHTGERPYQCSQCPSRFVNKSNLNKHMLIHKPDHDYKCDSCGRGFYTKRKMEVHLKVVHGGVKEHICNLCGKAFGYRKQMMNHQLSVHKREKFKSGRMPLYLQVESKGEQIGD